MTISVLILTLNEEANLGRCLQSLDWCDDIVVLDSFSSDGTEAIARDAGVQFHQRHFDSYAGQRNFGMSQIEYKHPWLLMVDADEVVPPDLAHEMKSVVVDASETLCLFRMRRKDFFMGKWIRRSSGYPTWFGRLARRGRVWVEREINEEYHTDGEVGVLQQHLYHYPFNKGLASWIDKHNRYSSMEAAMLLDRDGPAVSLAGLWAADPAERRKAAKGLFYALPARPVVAFAGLYFLKGGVLEGRAGLTFSILRALYEFMIDVKVRELRRRGAGMPL